jgi:Porin PorA
MKTRQIVAIIGVLLIAAGGVWKFTISPRYEQRFPAGWTWEYNSLGYTSYADEATRQFPEGTTLSDATVNISIRSVSAAAVPDNPAEVVITDHYETHNAATNAIEWEFSLTTTVNAATGLIVDGELADSYYFIPTHPEKTAYVVSNSSYRNLAMVFQGEEELLGINTYKYAFYGDLANKGSYSYIEFADNEDVYCYDFQMEYWVEPTTGEMVKYREWCEGDWVVDATTGTRLYAISRWGSESSGDDLIVQIANVKARLNTYRWMTQYIPLLLIVVGVLALVSLFMPGLFADKTEGKRSL